MPSNPTTRPVHRPGLPDHPLHGVTPRTGSPAPEPTTIDLGIARRRRPDVFRAADLHVTASKGESVQYIEHIACRLTRV